MVPPSTTVSRQRSERRIAVRLPLKVRGRDARGFPFEEDTASENLCRNGAAFVTHFDVAIGADLEIRIPFSQYASRRPGSSALSRSADADFSTHGRVVHVVESKSEGEKLVGVQFTGPRFQRVFHSDAHLWKSLVLTASILMPLATLIISLAIRPYGREVERLEALE